MTVKTDDIRRTFLEFFGRNGHEIVPSAPLVPHNDPTLMFTNAGMVPFKNVFTGAEKRPYHRATSSQKCVRAGGKHNDLDNVGYTARHHTFFEMLGNFSFGDYFKDGAIPFAWELLTKEYGLPKDKLWITVYHTDDDAFNIWKKVTGFPDSRIIRISTNDNFWAMGDTGPCGPCSEIYYNFLDTDPTDITNAGDDCVEIWNLVFMQYEQVDKEKRVNLPKPSIDTGMGLERLASVLQGKRDNYATDLFMQLIADARSEASLLGATQKAWNVNSPDIPYRVIADHLRASCFLIADGVLPSNEGRGYVLRRIMRRAMRYAHQIGCKTPLMYRLVPSLVKEMGEAYPELIRAQATITDNLRLEEERFKQTLERGLKLLEEESEKIKTGGALPGEAAFKLYDTYGFPLDLTQDILRGQNKSVDISGFEKSMTEQKERARAAWSGSGDKAQARIWFEIKDKVGASEFLGYTQEAAMGTLTAILIDGKEVNEVKSGQTAQLVFNQTPFYGESGGQIGDSGFIASPWKGEEIIAEITDTIKPVDGLHVHVAKITKGTLKLGDNLKLTLDTDRRARIRANHSATHILHAVLRRALGDHVTQKGSLVAADRLRFDVSHTKAISREELSSIEQEVNRIIWQNSPVNTRLMTPDDAIKAGAMALFGEKYGDEVRVLSMGKADKGDFSVELCGGTHVAATGDIGLFKILSESAVAAGIRRIEAVTRDGAFAYLASQDERVRSLAGDLKIAPEQLTERIESLMDERKKLEKELAEAKKKIALGGGGEAAPEKEMIGNIAFSSRIFPDLPPKELRPVAEDMLKSMGSGVIVVATSFEDKASIVVAVEKELSAKISAVDLVKLATETVGGKGGGGRPEMAQAGGPDAGKLKDAIQKIKDAMIAA